MSEREQIEEIKRQTTTYMQEIVNIFVSELKEGNQDQIRNDLGYLAYKWLQSKGFVFDGSEACLKLLSQVPNMQRARQKLQRERGFMPSDRDVDLERMKKAKATAKAMGEMKNEGY